MKSFPLNPEGKKLKEEAWGKLRSWFPQLIPTDSAEEPFLFS
jgi:hypothetical protein